MQQSERLRYGSVWRNLPLRTKSAVCLFLPVPALALAVIILGLGGFRRFDILLIPWMLAEIAAAVWVIESLLSRVRLLREAVRSIAAGGPLPAVHDHSWEINNLGQALLELAAHVRQQARDLEMCRGESERLFTEAGTACLETGPEGAIARANPAACRLLASSPDELLGKTAAEIWSSAGAESARERVRAQLQGGQPVSSYEIEYLRPDSARLLAAVEESLLHDSCGAVTGIRYLLSDRTVRLEAAAAAAECERQVREKEQERTHAVAAATEAREARSRFLGNVSNDLRVPLNSIVGFAELMVDGKIGPLSPDHRECAGDILASARHLSGVIDQLLDIARMESARPELRRENVPLENIVYNARYVLQVLNGQSRGVRIDVDLDPKLREVPADPFRLKRLVTSYLAYAVRTVPESGHVIVRTSPDGATAFRLEVESSSLAGTRDPARGDSALDPGNDPELTLAARLVEEQGGRAGFRHPPGRGWVLYAILPTTPGATVPEQTPQPVPAIPIADSGDGQALEQLLLSLDRFGAPAGAGLTVMVAGHQSSGLTAALAGAGYGTVELDDLRRTLDLAARGQPAAVIVDLEDIGVEGYRFVLRALRSVGLSTPVLGYPCAEVNSSGPSEQGAVTPQPPASVRQRLQPMPGPARKRSA